MRRFSLRHLFLLTSFFCLWFGAYAYWRNAAVFVVPLLCAYASAVVGFLHFNKNQTKQLKRVGLLTTTSIVSGYLGLGIPVNMIKSPLGLSILCIVWVIMLQGFLLAFHALMCVATSRRRVIALGVLLSALNLIVAFLMLQVLFDLSHFLYLM